MRWQGMVWTWMISTGLALSLVSFGSNVVEGDEPASTADATAPQAAILDKDVRRHIEFLASPALAGRSGRSKEQARKYIVEQWRSARLLPLFSAPSSGHDNPDLVKQGIADALVPSVPTYEQLIPTVNDANGAPQIVGHNIGAWLPGSDPKLAHEVVMIGAHYDHLGTRDGSFFPGADDNASGVAMLIEVSRYLASAKIRPRRTVVFLGFDLEENMLWGSRWFAAHPPWPIERVKLFMTADMIGRSLGGMPMPAVFVMGSERAPELRDALKSVGPTPGLEVCRLGTDIVGTRSDYGPFRDRQIPFLFFSTGEHPDYHTPRDTPDKIDFEKAARISSLILKLARHTADADGAPVWSEPLEGDLDEPRVLIRIATLLLDADKQRPLTSTQRFFVTNVLNQAKRIVESNRMTAEDRAWLVRMSQLLMLSVF